MTHNTNMWRRFLQWVMNNRPCKRYDVDGEPLFYRAFLFRVFGRVFYLHHYLRSDPDERGLHDHPARNLAIILAGGYYEERVAAFTARGLVNSNRWRGPGTLNYVSETAFHTIKVPEGRTSWSVFICSYVDKPWGFMKTHLAFEDNSCSFVYTEAGPGIQSDNPWWRAAPLGKEMRYAPAGGSEGYGTEPGTEPVGPGVDGHQDQEQGRVERAEDQGLPGIKDRPTQPHGWRGPGYAPPRTVAGQ